MKRVILLTVLSIIALVCHAQSLEPFKGAKTIIIECKDSTEVLYKKLGQLLTSNGYAIDHADKDFLSITTKPRETSKFAYNYVIKAGVTGNKIFLRMAWASGVGHLVGLSDNQYFDWEYSKGKNNVNGIIHNDLMAIVQQFDHVSLKYK